MYMEKGYTYSKIEDLQPTVQNAIHQELRVDQRRALQEVLQLTAYRYAPYLLKPIFWTSSDRFSSLVYTTSGQAPYITDDIQFFEKLSQNGLSIEGSRNRFAYIHLQNRTSPTLWMQRRNLLSLGKEM